MADVPTGTVTFLFTDIEGSTKLWEQSPESMRAALTRHDAILREGGVQEDLGGGTGDDGGTGRKVCARTANGTRDSGPSAACPHTYPTGDRG